MILAIDQGTTSTRSLIFNGQMQECARAQQELTQSFPQPGWVEHDPEEIWRSSVATARNALQQADLKAGALAAIGITNQRETLIVWDRHTGQAVYPAIVWQDRRSAAQCRSWSEEGHQEWIAERTGLRLDPYFSASKLHWLLKHQPGLRERAEKGELLAGTVETWLIWKFSGGRSHVTDISNAARTLLFDIHRQCWDADLLKFFGVPPALLPEVRDNACEFGFTESAVLGAELPILGAAGDQQAALIGQGCLSPGMVKSTYGTGCFIIQNTGTETMSAAPHLLTTVAYRLQGATCYALEGAIFVAGAAVQWLRDGLGLISAAAETEALARQARPDSEVVLVPAFVGLGAPHWQPDARAALFGLTRDSGAAEMARATLESVAFQTRDLLQHMHQASGCVLRVDGGMAASDWLLQCLADILDCPVDRPTLLESTSLGAAWLAGFQAGLYPGPEDYAKTWQQQKRFIPEMSAEERSRRCERWDKALAGLLANV